MLSVVVFAVILCVLPVTSWFNNKLVVDILPYDEECFFEYVFPDTRLNMRLQVVEGGFLDITFKEKLPNETEISTYTSDFTRFYHFKETGTYEFCFNNEMSSLTVKSVRIIYFILHEEEFNEMFVIKEDNSSVLAMVGILTEHFNTFVFENFFFESTVELHHELNEQTNKWVLWWAIFECLLLFALTIGQVYYIKRFFEVRRMV